LSKRIIRIILFILIAAILLHGCGLPLLPVATPQPTPEVVEPEEPEPEEPVVVIPPTPGSFTLRYEPEHTLFTMNPITARNRDNIVLGTLIYESLFILDDNLRAVPLLCESWETEDNVTFTIRILPDISMHDGSTLTADDVVYSLRQARARGRHMSKLRMVSSVSAEDEHTVIIVLESPNARFIRLLDIPIIKSGTIDYRIPPGTGPYIFPNPEAMQLTRFISYRNFDDLPLTTIHLLECNDTDLTDFFDNGRLSLLWDDPTDAFDVRINRQHEARFYNTTAIQYIGFNANSNVLRYQDVRRAIGCSIERQYIVDNIMNVPRPGQAIAAPTALSPVFDMYDPDWDIRGDPMTEMAALIGRVGLEDHFHESFLAMPDGYGNFSRFSLNFIVNIENAHKLNAANRIADNLRQYGFNVNVRGLQWTAFIEALEEGDFDMFYGETLIGADFDLSPLLLPGEGNLNFGRTGTTAFKPLIDSFLAAETQEEVSYAGEQLNLAIMQHAPFIPILYKRYAIYTPTGVLTSAFPGQSGVFHNFQDWVLDLYMLN